MSKKKFSKINEILQDAKRGKMFILVDDEGRENEGDLVIPASNVSQKNINSLKIWIEQQSKKEANNRKNLELLAKYLDKLTLKFTLQAGEDGKLFGSVTSRDIATRIQEATDIEVSQRMVLLSEPIREIVTKPVTIRFTRNTSIDITVDVQPDEESRPIVERLRAEAEAEEAAVKRAEAEAQEIASKQAADAAEQAAAEQAAAESEQDASSSNEVATNDTTEKVDESPEDGAV